jgi:hypothetical protein
VDLTKTATPIKILEDRRDVLTPGGRPSIHHTKRRREVRQMRVKIQKTPAGVLWASVQRERGAYRRRLLGPFTNKESLKTAIREAIQREHETPAEW